MPQLLGFVPDVPKSTPGVMVDCLNIVPTDTGFECGPSALDVMGVGPLASACRGGFIGETTAGTRRFFAGTQTKLFEYTSGSWTDVSKAGNYVGSSDNRWSFCQFGNFTIGANGVEALQATSSGAFATISGAPVARVVVSVSNFVMAFNTSDGAYGTRQDAWWCSGIFDHTTWTPSLSTQANTGRLVSAGGAITAGLAFGEQVVAYKTRSMFLGTYVGGDAVWDFRQVQGDVGCVGPEAVCDIGGAHFFVGDDNLWIYDGVRPRPLGDGTIRQWFIENSSPSFRYRTIVQYERRNNRVWIFFPSTSTQNGDPDRAIVYHLARPVWGVGNIGAGVQAAVTFSAPGITFNTLDDVGATFDELPDISFDSQYWLAGSRALAVFNLSNQAQTLTGPSVGGSWTSNDIGSDTQVTLLDLATITFNTTPTASNCGGATRRVSGGEVTYLGGADLLDGQYKLRQSGRWHSLTFNFTGPASMSAYDVRTKPVGLR